MYLKIGTITKQIGLKGEVKVYSTTFFAEKRYKKGNVVYIKIGEEYKALTIRTYRKLDRSFDVISFEEYPNIDSTFDLIKNDLYATKDEKILKKNEYFYSDLVSCKIFSTEGNELGVVKSVEEFPAQITLKCLSLDKKEFYVPFISQFIKDVDIIEKKIIIELIEGLL